MTRASELNEVFQNKQVHSQWESVYRHGTLQHRLNECIMDRLMRWMPAPSGVRVLDAGCGTGEHLCRLATRGYHVTGVDISHYALQRARQRAESLGLNGRVAFSCCGLEDLSPVAESFDVIHCRGVLMHIPRYQDALRELCRLLKPGGRIIIMENNSKSLETAIVRAVRMVRAGNSRMIASNAGLEFHCQTAGQAPLWRIANLRTLCRELSQQHVRTIARFATEFWDINRLSAGLPRQIAQLFNLGWFSMLGPARWSLGNAIVGEKNQAA